MDGSEKFSGSGGKRVLSLPSNTIGFQAVIALQGRVASQNSADFFYYKVPEPSPSGGAEIAAGALDLRGPDLGISAGPVVVLFEEQVTPTVQPPAQRGSPPYAASGRIDEHCILTVLQIKC